MKIDGKQIALQIYENLKNRVGELHKKGITPHLAVILIGNNPSSQSYVAQKRKWAEYIDALVTIHHYKETVSHEEIRNKIQQLNQDATVHAILLQRPVPPQINENELELLINPQKDIDGFHPDSPYTLPVALAVIKILMYIYKEKFPGGETSQEKSEFLTWLKNQKIAILGKGQTAGQPISNYLTKLNVSFHKIDSQTINPVEITTSADIIISAVGKENIITPHNSKLGAILIGVGLFKGNDGKMHGDYNEEAIKDTAEFYTPTPGGVGPVNVAMLMDNLITATERQVGLR
jgi:methylenetetrahydrofolate dehydrogenase (NADP+)/methenyltetrahydrofolate cyclohydrolase